MSVMQSPQSGPLFDVDEFDVIYAEPDGEGLKARIYQPVRHERESPLPAAIDVHGGAWNSYDRKAGAYYDRALAARGMLIMAVDFRQGPTFQHPLASRDLVGAIRWLRHQASALDVDQASIGLIGSSSGGHLALLAGLAPDADMHQGTRLVADGKDLDIAGTDASVRYVIALWPVSNPAERYDYAERIGRDELLKMQRAYFGDRDTMAAAAVTRVLDSNERAARLPDLFLLQPGADGNIPQPMTLRLIEAWQSAEGRLDYHFVPGLPHAYGHQPSAESDDLITAMADFIRRTLGRPSDQR